MIDPLLAFSPILGPKPRILILGSMPGGQSLQFNQYYAHPRNLFWRFMGDIYTAGPLLPYDERIAVLKEKNVAVWDVLNACERSGSMDADIKNPEPNDFATFYAENPSIRHVVFNSLTAENFYRRLVMPTLSNDLAYHRVPSPSPAYARLNYEEKLKIWREVLTKI